MLRRPGCCCKRQTLCAECGNHTCFKCGKPWHENACVEERIDGAIARYLLIAECIKCKAPITKNGACNHMTCSRCNAEFCWICRKNYRGHKRFKPYDISWTLGCDALVGDTAPAWLCIMLFLFLVSPFHALIEIGIGAGYFLRSVLSEVRDYDEEDK